VLSNPVKRTGGEYNQDQKKLNRSPLKKYSDPTAGLLLRTCVRVIAM